MRLVKFLKSQKEREEYILMIVDVNEYERSALASLIIDVCEQKDKRLRLDTILDSLKALMALYPMNVSTPTKGCTAYFYAETDFWNFVKALCMKKDIEDEEVCARHVIEVISDFLEVISRYRLISRR